MNRNNIIVVGTGDYYGRVLSHVLSLLEKENFANVIATVDVVKRRRTEHLTEVEHLIREDGQKLSSLLSNYTKYNPIVLLGQANQYHTPDAIDLPKNP